MPLYGADVSGHQFGFDFAANRQVCSFIIVKQTEGLTWPTDDNQAARRELHDMRDGAQNQDYVWVGLYHYARPQPGRTGRQEAEHFIRAVGDLHPHEGVVLDYEENGGLDHEELEQFAIDFVDTIEARWPSLTGNVLFYTYPGFVAGMSTDRLVSRCPLYIAGYGPNDGHEHESFIRLDRWPSFCLWQYTSKGSMPGWAGPLDLNRFDGDEVGLRALRVDNGDTVVVQPPPPTTPPPLRPPWPGEYLREGSTGDAVRTLQQRLVERGWRVEVDGHFGSATAAVVVSFQREKGLTDDGIVGPATWDALWTAPVDGPTAPAVPPFPGVMRRGDSGEGVRQLQQRLKDRGWNIGVDGNFGRQTVTVVSNFQKEKGLEPDGVVGQKTWTAVWTAPGQVVVTPPPPPPPSPPPPPPPEPGVDEHPDPVGQITAWVFANGVAGFQEAFAWWNLTADGDAGPMTARAVMHVVNNDGRLSPHFSIAEFACKHCGQVKAWRPTLESLESEREILGRGINIISGYRCPEHNERVGGARNSQHLYGKAGDKNTLVSSSEAAGFTGIGTCGDDCLHGDRRDQGSVVYWAYC